MKHYTLRCYRGEFNSDSFSELYTMAESWKCSYDIINNHTGYTEMTCRW